MTAKTNDDRHDEVYGAELDSHQVVIRPIVTEKGVHRSTRLNQYAFEVNMQANKDRIRAAIEDLFEVRVIKVCTQRRRGKPRRYRFRRGRTKTWKKAIVTLHADDRIQFF
jgi:large subunit ribosomal protein L23